MSPTLLGLANSAAVRRPAVAGAFYPGSRLALEAMVSELFEAARVETSGFAVNPTPLGILVPHAGLSYSGVVAACGWAQLTAADQPPSVVLLGTNHSAAWLDGIGVWENGAWHIPTGDLVVDETLAAAILDLGRPFVIDHFAHEAEHSIEVQLPLLHAVAPRARIVPLAVSAGRGPAALDAGRRLGLLLARERAAGATIVLAISSDMAHYPPAGECEKATDALAPAILAVDGATLVMREQAVCANGVRGLVCGMCGIEPAALGLAALRAMGAAAGTLLATATSADAGGSRDRTVGYLAARFDRDDAG